MNEGTKTKPSKKIKKKKKKISRPFDDQIEVDVEVDDETHPTPLRSLSPRRVSPHSQHNFLFSLTPFLFSFIITKLGTNCDRQG